VKRKVVSEVLKYDMHVVKMMFLTVPQKGTNPEAGISYANMGSKRET